MKSKSWKITPGSYYIRRRDKLLVTPSSVTGQGVVYKLVKNGAAFKVTIDGFKRGFRPALPEEIPNEMATTAGAAVTGE